MIPMPPAAPPLSSSALRTPRLAIVALCGLSLAGLVLRLWIGWQAGYLADLQCWQLWGLDPGEFIVRPEYDAQTLVPNNYPPLYPAVLRIMRWVHRGLNLPGDYTTPLRLHFHDDPDQWRPLILYLKLPPILADIVTAWLLFLIGRLLGRPWLGVGVAAFYCFSPGIIYDGAYFGQADTVLVMFIVAALWAYLAQRPVWLGAMLMAAPLMKMQAVFALPVLGLALISQWRVWWPWVGRMLLGGLITLTIVTLLAWWTGQLRQFHDGYFGLIGMYPLVTVRAYNFWWLLTRIWDRAPMQWDFPRDDTLLLGLVSYRTVGAVLFFAALGLILWRLHKARYTPFALALALAAAGWAFFNFPTQMHERYSVPAVALTTLLPLWGRRWWWPTVLVSVSAMYNIADACPFIFPPYRPAATVVNALIFSEWHITWSFLALLHILMVPLLVDALWREGRAQAAAAAPPGAFPTQMENGSVTV